MKNRLLSKLFIVCLLSFLFASCSNDDNDNSSQKPPINTDELPKDETWVIFNGTETWAGGIYALGDNKSREINLASVPFYQLGYSAGGRVVDNVLYKKDGATSNDYGISKYSLSGGKFSPNGFVSTPNNTYETNFLVVNNTEGYYWDLSAGGLKVQKFNPSTMQRTGEIDFSSLSNGSQYEAAGQLILAKRDNKLFVDVQHGTKTSAWQVTPTVKKVEIAVYNLITNEIESVTEHAGATNLGLFADHVLWSIDEVTKDLYVVAVGDMRTQTPASRILRIKNGETKFDPTFELKISDYQYPSDFNRIFAYDSKIYTTISGRATSYYGGGQHGVTYRQDIWYWTEIDVNTKKAKRLSNMLPDNFYSYQNPFYHKGNIYFVTNNASENFSGVYQYNPKNGEVKETFRLKGSGRLMGFNILQN
ncbi:hypothetical protein [Chryseobacterium oryctis]|uniref:DUF4374 domain-containing protein n=1 Tax=Chryseobacterium oryctis TaxID=2952618 RepID=A0ABT3HKP8_9FLAO|nr:hypothetical protein [Chryseobacterium oryctis]MCW3160298.1 hypothetical protein [Chryseobacterium oryctis]